MASTFGRLTGSRGTNCIFRWPPNYLHPVENFILKVLQQQNASEMFLVMVEKKFRFHNSVSFMRKNCWLPKYCDFLALLQVSGPSFYGLRHSGFLDSNHYLCLWYLDSIFKIALAGANGVGNF